MEQKTVILPYQGRADGSIEAFEVGGHMVVPMEDGVAYVRWEDVEAFFPQAEGKLPRGSKFAAEVLQEAMKDMGRDNVGELQKVVDFLLGKAPAMSAMPMPKVDIPEGATHYQPNPSTEIAGLFWRKSEGRWQSWYGRRWNAQLREGVTPPGLVRIIPEEA